jgi:hypothetical protein
MEETDEKIIEKPEDKWYPYAEGTLSGDSHPFAPERCAREN